METWTSLRRQLEAEGRLTIAVKVTPKSARTAVAGQLADGTWKLKVAAVPEKGRANAALCEFLAREFGVPKSAVRITSGETSQRKRVVVVKASGS